MSPTRSPSLKGDALKSFRRTIRRVRALLELHPILHGTQGRPNQAVADVLRGALVLSLAALDAFVCDALLEAVPLLAKRKGALGANVTKWAKERPEQLVDSFAAPDPFEALVAICRNEIGSMTFQKSAAIEGILVGSTRCSPPWSKVAESLQWTESEWTESEVKGKLDEYVQRRNRIVHGGDLTPERTYHGYSAQVPAGCGRAYRTGWGGS